MIRFLHSNFQTIQDFLAGIDWKLPILRFTFRYVINTSLSKNCKARFQILYLNISDLEAAK